MAIAEFHGAPERPNIVHVGAISEDAANVFQQHGYNLITRSDADLNDGELAATSAVILSQRADKPVGFFRDLERHGRRLLDWDCRIFIRVASDKGLKEKALEIVVNAIRTLGLPPGQRDKGIALPPFVYICDSAVQLTDIARLVRRVEPGKAPNLDLVLRAVDSSDVSLTLEPDEDVLLRRAFWDCSSVDLRQMPAGLSGASIYRAHAALAEGVLGPWPHPFFVKLGPREKIEAEYFGYRANLPMYIPFHLAPRLDFERSCLASTKGILVGDLVEEGQLLKDCARHGRAVPAIANLFNKTLRGWYLTSREEPALSLLDGLMDFFPAAAPSFRAAAIRELGATLDVAEMRRRLTACDSRPVRMGHVHGDLHAGNILVRGSDAIVIDFEKSSRQRAMPILYDAASLEGGLLVDGFIRDRRDIMELVASLAPLYSGGQDLRWRVPCQPRDPSSWFYDCVHQIRIQARQMECQEFQYSAVLAFVLIKKACNTVRFSEQSERLRALAYLLAEKLLTNKGSQ